MRRTIATMLMLGALGGCGSDGPGGDTIAPTVTLTASSASIEGGETTAITVTATDNVDTSVTPKLSCNGGTLVGNLLVTNPVTADTTIACTATATDAAGNTGSGTLNVTVKATVASLVVPTGLATLKQGQAGALFATNLPLTNDTYTATLGGRQITLGRGTSNTLEFLVPTDLAAGSYQLAVTIGTRNYSFPITVQAAAAIADARGYATDVLTRSRDGIDAFIAANRSNMTAPQLASVQSFRATVADTLASLGTMSAADLTRLAILFQSNPSLTETSVSAAAFDPAQCTAASGRFVAKNIAAIATLGISYAVFYYAPDPIAKTLAAVGMGIGLGILVSKNGVLDEVQNVVNYCINEEAYSIDAILNGNSAGRISALAVIERYGFRPDQARSFTVNQTLSLDSSVRASVTSNFARLTELVSKFPYVPASISQPLAAFVTQKTQAVPSSEVTLGTISRSEVTGTKTGSGSTVTLAFKPVGTPSGNIDFSFVLNRASGVPIEVPAQLVISTPTAQDLSLTATQGTAVRSSFVVGGQTSIEIVSQPTKGQVTLGSGTDFTYTPLGQSFGSDQFTYRARNADGVSRTATVLISVERKFDGVWRINSRSTTTSQSRPNLCPAENNNFTITIAKVSDTNYTTSYMGFPITLTMASKDDPNGLSGQISGTYADSPGQTTETLKVAVPNSTTITGSSVFTYNGPNGDTCSGTTTVTGVR